MNYPSCMERAEGILNNKCIFKLHLREFKLCSSWGHSFTKCLKKSGDCKLKCLKLICKRKISSFIEGKVFTQLFVLVKSGLFCAFK